MSDEWMQEWQPLVEMIGQDLSDGTVTWGADPVEAGAVRRYLEPLEFDCPLHTDTEVAQSMGYDDITLPYTGVLSWTLPAMWSPGETLFDSHDRNAQPVHSPIGGNVLPAGPTVSGYFATGMEIDFLREVIAGERVGRRGKKLLSCVPKETKVGRGAFVQHESEVITESGEVVARIRVSTYSYQPRNEYEEDAL